MAELFAMISERSAMLMHLSDYHLKVGNPADVLIFSASLQRQANLGPNLRFHVLRDHDRAGQGPEQCRPVDPQAV